MRGITRFIRFLERGPDAALPVLDAYAGHLAPYSRSRSCLSNPNSWRRQLPQRSLTARLIAS